RLTHDSLHFFEEHPHIPHLPSIGLDSQGIVAPCGSACQPARESRDADDVEAELFNEAADVLRSLLPPSFGDLRMRPRRYGIKVWFGSSEPAKEHYEAQVVGPRQVPEAAVLALE